MNYYSELLVLVLFLAVVAWVSTFACLRGK